MSPTRKSQRRSRRRAQLLLVVAAGLSATVLLAGCAGLAATSDGTTVGEPAGAAVGGGTQPDEAGGKGADAAVAAPGAPAVAPAVLDSPAVVVTGSATVRAGDVPVATRTVTRLAATYGGRVDGQSTTAATGPGAGAATSVTTVRVPPARVSDFLDELPAIGTVISSELTRADASAEVADVTSRVANARASVARMRVLLERATKLSDVVMLESEMSRRQSDLEALEARARALADQTSLATLTVTVVAQDAVLVDPEPGTGFLAGLSAGWTAFVSASVTTLTVVGLLTPFLVLALVLAAAGLLAYRRRRTPAAPGPEPART